MAEVSVKCFGVLRLDSKIDTAAVDAATVAELFPKVNELIETELAIGFDDALVYINGLRCKSKKQKLNAGDEVWLLSPASGG